MNLFEDLKSNSYPGRGIVIGKSPDGKNAVIAYFIMGRSENSRNRVFSEFEDDLRTKAFDESKIEDPSLIIYNAVRVLGSRTIITNGDQTDTVYQYLKKGNTFAAALRTRSFEPDAPNFTPRISGVTDILNGKLEYKLSILRCADSGGHCCQRFYFEYPNTVNGKGHFIHTYKEDGDPIPSYDGVPKTIDIDGDIDSFKDRLWQSLNERNRVSLFVRFIDLECGKYITRIVNKHC